MTFLGKLFVFLNVFIAVALLTWAVSLYTNRVDWTEARDGDVKVTDRIVQLQKAIVSARDTYTLTRSPTAPAEASLGLFRNSLAARLTQAQKGEFYELFPDGRTLDLASTTPIKAITKKPDGTERQLPGVDVLQAELLDSVKQAATHVETITKARTERAGFSDETLAFNANANRMKELLKEMASEKVDLQDNRINWDAQLATLSKRNDQLAKRLKELETGTPTALVFPTLPR
jgi:hypothetical protein